MSAVIVIPARYDSARFPGKPLAPLRGKPVIQHVYENCKKAGRAEAVIVATDSETILETVRSFGGTAVMTSPLHNSGTDRVAEVAGSTHYDIIVNVQGDEPLIRPQMVDEVIALLSESSADIGTLVKRIEEPGEIRDPNIVKAVFGDDGVALYFSRSPIPYHRDLFGTEGQRAEDAEARKGYTSSELYMFKHIGIYSYRREVLLRLTALKPTRLEETEKLEQLRALEHRFSIKVKETSFEVIGVDTPQDLERVETWLSLSS